MLYTKVIYIKQHYKNCFKIKYIRECASADEGLMVIGLIIVGLLNKKHYVLHSYLRFDKMYHSSVYI